MHDAIDEVIGLSKNQWSGNFKDAGVACIQKHKVFGAFRQFRENNLDKPVVMTLAHPFLKLRYLGLSYFLG